MRKLGRLILLLFGLAFIFGSPACKKDKDKDTTAPIITILGNNPLTQCVGVPYTDPGATASDDKDGDLTSKIQVTIAVDVSVEGTGHVTYEVSDTAGNKASATRTDNVIFCK